MAHIIAQPCIGTKDTACVDVCPVDCIHPRKDEEGFEPDPRSEGRLVEPTEQTARARLGEQFDAEWGAGSGMALEEAVVLARGKE